MALYMILAGVLCFWRLGETGLVSMEGMVADGGHYMIESGDWIVPRIYGEVHTYKPALAYWLAAVPYGVADQPSEWLLRLPFAAAGLALGLMILILTGRLGGPRLGLLCALAATSNGLFIQKVRIAEYDIALAAGVGVAIVAACCNLARDRPRAGTWIVGYVALTFGLLAKGMLALMLYGPGLLVAAVATRRWRRLLELRHVAAVLLFGGLVLGYFLLAYSSVGAQAFAQPLWEAGTRSVGWTFVGHDDLSPVAKALRSAAKPVLVMAAFVPWSVLLPLGFRTRAADLADRRIGLLLVSAQAFLVTGVVVFMAVPTHEMRYYLPLCAPLGIICGIVVEQAPALNPKWCRRTVAVTLITCLVVAAALAAQAFLSPAPAVQLPERAGLLLIAILVGTATVFLVRRPVRERLSLMMLLAALGTLAAESFGFQQVRASNRSLESEAVEVASFLPDDEPVWVLGPSEWAGKSASLLFYLRRPILSFHREGRMPPPDSHCLLTSDRVSELEKVGGVTFREIARVEHPARDILVGRCRPLPDTASSSISFP